MPVKIFPSVAEAEQWLQRQKEGADEKDLFEQHNSRNQYQ
jgi:hypothetical protein